MVTDATFFVDPCACPLCGQPNQCAMEAAKSSGQAVAPCWCLSVSFSAEVLARVPEAAQNKACICQACASSASSSPAL
ncbi:MAG: cysteine-rich CWC family protein [Limnohabitans sp.]